MKSTLLLIISLLLLIFTPFAMPARADGTSIVTVVLARSSGNFACGDLVAGVVRITDNLQVPMEVYGSSDSVRVQVVIPNRFDPVSEQGNIGSLTIIQPGETMSFAFSILLSSDPAVYANTATGAANQANVMGDVYHSTTY